MWGVTTETESEVPLTCGVDVVELRELANLNVESTRGPYFPFVPSGFDSSALCVSPEQLSRGLSGVGCHRHGLCLIHWLQSGVHVPRHAERINSRSFEVPEVFYKECHSGYTC